MRKGGGNSEGIEGVFDRLGIERESAGPGGLPLVGGRESVGPSVLTLLRGGSGAPKKWAASTEPPSSMGVKMLRDFEDRCLGRGGLLVSGGFVA